MSQINPFVLEIGVELRDRNIKRMFKGVITFRHPFGEETVMY